MTPSTLLAATLAHRNVHYGWVVVGVTFLTLLVTAAAMGMPGVLIVPLEKEFGWDNAQISSALAIRIMLFGLFGPFAAAFMNRFGVRRVIIFAMALIVRDLVPHLRRDVGGRLDFLRRGCRSEKVTLISVIALARIIG